MSLTEADIITRYFQQPGLCSDPRQHPSIPLGIGDDCALLAIPQDQQLAVSMDVLVADVHFPATADPALIAQRALAVNLSDLAAMGAVPLGFTLGLTLPQADAAWLDAFTSGLRASALRYGCPLFGGNLTKGPLQICIQVHGLVPAGKALSRSGARPGDEVYVSGEPGRAGLALALLQGKLTGASMVQEQELLAAYYQPEPRLALGEALRGVASAAQDVSDGVLGDLRHIARQSAVRIIVDAAALPVAGVLSSLRTPAEALMLILTAGDDYELVFTAPPAQRAAVMAAADRAGLGVTRIGHVAEGSAAGSAAGSTVESGVQVVDKDGQALRFDQAGYEHFGGQ